MEDGSFDRAQALPTPLCPPAGDRERIDRSHWQRIATRLDCQSASGAWGPNGLPAEIGFTHSRFAGNRPSKVKVVLKICRDETGYSYLCPNDTNTACSPLLCSDYPEEHRSHIHNLGLACVGGEKTSETNQSVKVSKSRKRRPNIHKF
ncbi:unnamed protein product [Protopolystoma xenopodis]|uniref:Uncharacterized protein n=1 Tax=Protopolystoma xenopodis TaxID=117903 RepID=A0A3S4ZZF5_9PLAT|nr:unnamed protein product [Protopolystoma xenopodis]